MDERAAEKKPNLIILGDANLCSEKWHLPSFGNKKVAKSLQCTLERCGLKISTVGPTFQSDHIKPNGEVCESALDLVYFSADFENKLITRSIKNNFNNDYSSLDISKTALVKRPC